MPPSPPQAHWSSIAWARRGSFSARQWRCRRWRSGPRASYRDTGGSDNNRAIFYFSGSRITSREFAANCIQCLHAYSASAGRRPGSGYSQRSRSGGPATLRPIAAGDYRTRKPSGGMHVVRNFCSRSTAAGPLTARRDATWRVISIILAGRMRSPSGAKVELYSSPCAVSNRARKLLSTMGGNIICTFSRMVVAVARRAAPRRRIVNGKARQHGNPRNLTVTYGRFYRWAKA